MNSTWPALVNGAILSVLLAAALGLALRLTPRRVLNAATRYIVWWIALGITLGLPAVFLNIRAFHSAATPPFRVLELAPQPGNAPPRQPGTGVVHLAPGLRIPVEIPSGVWMRWLLAAWIVTTALLLLRLLLSHLAVCRAVARASELPWRRLAGAGRRTIRFARSDDVAVPVATGPFRPSILIPTALFDALHGDDLDQIGLHEAAHLARRDDYALLVERVVEALFSLHPVVRWMARQIDLEREIACDDLVVEATGQPRRYADCLTRMVALCGSVRGSLAVAHASGNRSHFSQRVELLLDRARDTRSRVAAVRLTGFAAMLMAVTCILARMPGLLALAEPQKETTVTFKTKLAIAAVTAAVAAQPAIPAPAAPQAQVQAQAQPGRLLVLFFDGSLTPDGFGRASGAAGKFVQSQLKPDDKAAIMSGMSGSVKVMQDFTDDKNLLLRTIQQAGAGQDSAISEAVTPDSAAAQVNIQLSTLETLAHMLTTFPEKKVLIYFSEGIGAAPSATRAQLQAAIDAAVRANMAIYPVDVRAIVANPPH